MGVRRSNTRRSSVAGARRVVSALERRAEGDGGADGIVLDLDMEGDGLFSAIYTVPVTVGTNAEVFSLQVDTGSSDFWLASTSCSSQACTNNRPRLYDPASSSRSTGVDFDINYLSGRVEGPVVWDDVSIGGYPIAHQALAAATTVVNQTLSQTFSGILGLALPLNSVILDRIPGGTTSDPDGAPFTSNLFGIEPIANRPPQHFYSIALGRPGSTQTPSVLGIGRHPSDIVDDPSRILYSSLLSEVVGTLFWKVQMRALTVFVNGREVNVDLGRSVKGSAFPEAILDTGVPYIIARPGIANAIWGAMGVSPAEDGMYYLPCTTPLNITITLDDRPPISLHPLDLTAYPSGDRSSRTCVGLIQSSSVLDNAQGVGDIILGVPFLRNVYTVMSYLPADASGTIGAPGSGDITPQLGLLGLTDPERATTEFSDVRLHNRPIDNDRTDDRPEREDGGPAVPVGVIVLLALLGFVALCALVFVGRWWYMKRKYRHVADGSVQGHDQPRGDMEESQRVLALGNYQLAPWRSGTLSEVPSVDTQATLAAAYTKGSKELDRDRDTDAPRSLSFKLDSGYDTERTRVGVLEADDPLWGDKELGFKNGPGVRDPDLPDDDWDPRTSWVECYSPNTTPMLGEWRPEHDHEHGIDGPPRLSLSSQRLSGSVDLGVTSTSALAAIASAVSSSAAVTTPLLASSHSKDDSDSDGGHSPSDDDAEFGVIGGGMAGIGTAKRGSAIDESLTLDMKRRSAGVGGVLGGVGSVGSAQASIASTSVPSGSANPGSGGGARTSKSSAPPSSFPASLGARPSTSAAPPSSFPASLGARPMSLMSEAGIRPKGLRVHTEPIRRSALSQVYTRRDLEEESPLNPREKPLPDPTRMSR